MTQGVLFAASEVCSIKPLCGEWLRTAIDLLEKRHYAHCVPSGKSHYFLFGDAIVCYSIPANKNIGKFLLGRPAVVWELTRLWAPDGHAPNLLTEAISATVRGLRLVQPEIEALVSYADPNAGHHGGVYRAASWLYTGQSEESRYYLSPTGQVVARRAFHSGSHCLRKSEIEARGFRQLTRPGKHRFVRPLSRHARRHLQGRFSTTGEKHAGQQSQGQPDSEAPGVGNQGSRKGR